VGVTWPPSWSRPGRERVNAVAPLALREAHEPPEVRGAGRDDVSMLVADAHAGSLVHARFCDLPSFLREGDLLVVNNSATLPAALPAELRAGDGSRLGPPPPGSRVALPGGAHADLLAQVAGSARLSIARLELGAPLETYLRRHGRPIRYGYVPSEWPLDAYQTVFALQPGSAELPSAGRPFTARLVTELVSRGVLIAPITLHTGVSSPELDEPPSPELYRIPEATAGVVNAVRGRGGRVIAVGTTVVRALETTAQLDGTVAPGEGRTNVVVTPRTGVRAVDGLLTGWHEPRSTHLQMLEALAGDELVERCYREAAARGYRLHEFGDLHLII
jgi:S-adenosylmethionine:tRNA ribosyltransferase-isomerase